MGLKHVRKFKLSNVVQKTVFDIKTVNQLYWEENGVSVLNDNYSEWTISSTGELSNFFFRICGCIRVFLHFE